MLNLDRAVEVLTRTPAALRGLLGGVSDFWATSNYGEGTFSPFDVVGHLTHADRTNWLPRARHILAHGESLPFPAFDRYAMYVDSKGRTMGGLLDEFAAARADSLAGLRALGLTPGQLELTGTHPQLGRVTLSNLMAAWVVHDLGHTHQVAKAMAYQYRDAVGPWRDLLTILPRS